MQTQWRTELRDPDHVSVWPLDDLIDHDVDSDDCVCGPKTEPVERDDGSIAWILAHEALDGRL